MKRLLTVLIISGLAIAFSNGQSTANDRLRGSGSKIYDSNSQYKGSRIYDSSGKYKGRIDNGGRLYDSSGRHKGKIENQNIIDFTEPKK